MKHITTIREFETSERQCRDFILDNNIISPTKGEKAIRDLTRHLSYALVKSGMMGRKFKTFVSDYKQDKIIDVSFLTETGNHNWLDYVNENYKLLAEDLFQVRPVGLGSPNSACGEGEFMLLCLSHKCRKPSRGDIEVNLGDRSLIIELKGENPRVTSGVLGTNFRQSTIKLCEEFKLQPNVSRRGRIPGVQITSGGQIRQHWIDQFSKITPEMRKLFVTKWLVETGAFTEVEAEESATKILESGYINIDTLKKEIIKYFFKFQVSVRGEFTNMAFFQNLVVKIITNNVDEFFEAVDKDEIRPVGDYFRLNQNTPIAWYLDCGLNVENDVV
jgi:hypothetical protein